MASASDAVPSNPQGADEISALRQQLASQQTEIEKLRSTLESQQRLLEKLAASQSTTRVSAAALPAATAAPAPAAVQVEDRTTVKLEELAKRTETGLRNLGGFQFSGDFRFRADAQVRSGNEVAGPLQNVRSRYRVRLNIDKQIDPRFRFHLQLSTGPYNNEITNDQDFAGIGAKHPFSISEASIEYRPNPNIQLRGGRMEEVLADHMRFLWDDDLRLNGFDQMIKIPLRQNGLGLTSIELRAGEYFLTNPGVYVLAPNSPFVAAGFEPGKKVRSSNLFHPGVMVRGDIGRSWGQQLMAGVQLYRHPDQIQLASTPNGFPVLVSNALGLQLSGPLSGGGNATTTPGGAMYSAPNFQIAHIAYRLERKGVKIGGREMPAWVDVQGSRNVGTSQLRDAFMVSANLGAIRNAGDLRFLYQFAVKDANSLISQFTDDDLGTGSGVNIAVNAFRVDLGLARFLQFQNLLFVQNQRRASDPARQLFIPLQRGANTTFRYLGQLAFSF